jgi:hypothetical protein
MNYYYTWKMDKACECGRDDETVLHALLRCDT